MHTYIPKDKNRKPIEGADRVNWKIDTRAERTQIQALNYPEMVKSWDYIMGTLHADVSMSDGVGSYNWGFDSRAINITNRTLNHSAILPTWDFKPFCIQDMYVRKIINNNYFKFISELDETERENYMSKSNKNLGYSAEVMARYINQHTDYVESHTSLDDANIEFELTRLFCDRHFSEFVTDFLGNPLPVSWREVAEQKSSAEKMRIRRNDPKQLGKGIKQSEEQKDFFK